MLHNYVKITLLIVVFLVFMTNLGVEIEILHFISAQEAVCMPGSENGPAAQNSTDTTSAQAEFQNSFVNSAGGIIRERARNAGNFLGEYTALGIRTVENVDHIYQNWSKLTEAQKVQLESDAINRVVLGMVAGGFGGNLLRRTAGAVGGGFLGGSAALSGSMAFLAENPEVFARCHELNERREELRGILARVSNEPIHITAKPANLDQIAAGGGEVLGNLEEKKKVGEHFFTPSDNTPLSRNFASEDALNMENLFAELRAIDRELHAYDQVRLNLAENPVPYESKQSKHEIKYKEYEMPKTSAAKIDETIKAAINFGSLGSPNSDTSNNLGDVGKTILRNSLGTPPGSPR